MPYILKQSTASQEVVLGPFLDDTDGKTAETGLTIANTDILLHKTGGTTLPAKNRAGQPISQTACIMQYWTRQTQTRLGHW
jgi:hypothetical protein